MRYPSMAPSSWRAHCVCFRAVLMCLIATPVLSSVSFGWIYPEHRDITLRGIQKLDPQRQAVLEKIWVEARSGFETRLSAVPADATQGERPNAIDYAAWPAIAGDHSCSAANMLQNVLETPWILDVADVCARLKNRLAVSTRRSERINHLRDSDIQLQRVDPEYATRAGSNNVHFLLARTRDDVDARTYLTRTFREGTELNALGTYLRHHLSALKKISRLSRDSLAPAQRGALARAALADEAFGLHFLEDVFASGHIAGTWGDASLRKGTHDYYNEHGLETATWSGRNIVLTWDAWMRAEDAEPASEVISKSLAQFVDAFTGAVEVSSVTAGEEVSEQPDTFNVCRNSVHDPLSLGQDVIPLLAQTLRETPVPALGPGLGELPRFRAELGPFIGVAPSAFAGTLGGGFAPAQTSVGGMGGVGFAVRVGLGLEGIINEAGDGLVFLDVGIREDAASSQKITEAEVLQQYGAITAAIPGRTAYSLRLRLPFWLIPGDLILAAPVLLLVSPQTYTQMAVVAGGGGLIPWQAGISTFLGRFQFILGREVGMSMFGYGKEEDRMIIPYPDAPGGAELISFRSLQFDFPLLEYRPFRTFSLDQSSSLVLQLSGGFDVPLSVDVVGPAGAPQPEMRTIWHAGLRLAFDWRYYLGSSGGGGK